jgi:predicted RNA-binding Zn-ribbon protein involved in translation (DUF1610 family)
MDVIDIKKELLAVCRRLIELTGTIERLSYAVEHLDTHGLTLRAPERNEQKCPSCGVDCLPIADGLIHRCPSCGASLGISKRSSVR